MTTRPEVEDLLGWLKLQTTPTGETLAAYSRVLDTALALVESRINLPAGTTNDDYPDAVSTAVLLTAARLAKRATTPEGIAGFGDFAAVRIGSFDPDVETLLGRFLKLDGFY